VIIPFVTVGLTAWLHSSASLTRQVQDLCCRNRQLDFVADRSVGSR
jgi:hypothetical protein